MDIYFGADTYGLGQMIIYLNAIFQVINNAFSQMISNLAANLSKLGLNAKDLLNNTTTTTTTAAANS